MRRSSDSRAGVLREVIGKRAAAAADHVGTVAEVSGGGRSALRSVRPEAYEPKIYDRSRLDRIIEVTQPESEEETGKSSAKILDLTELLQRSLRKGGDKKEEPKARKPLAKSAARKRAPAKTAARRKAA